MHRLDKGRRGVPWRRRACAGVGCRRTCSRRRWDRCTTSCGDVATCTEEGARQKVEDGQVGRECLLAQSRHDLEDTLAS